MQKAQWTRTVMNGGEPDNRVYITAELQGENYAAIGVYGILTFKDGQSFVSIARQEDGSFLWVNNPKTGSSPTFSEAWQNLPAFVTNPDHYEESPIVEIN
jgi:hypothetical protein